MWIFLQELSQKTKKQFQLKLGIKMESSSENRLRDSSWSLLLERFPLDKKPNTEETIPIKEKTRQKVAAYFNGDFKRLPEPTYKGDEVEFYKSGIVSYEIANGLELLVTGHRFASGKEKIAKIALSKDGEVFVRLKISKKLAKEMQDKGEEEKYLKKMRKEIRFQRIFSGQKGFLQILYYYELLEEGLRYPVIVTKYCGGGNLTNFISQISQCPKGKEQNKEKILRIIFSLLNGLIAFRKNRVVHRDIKPNNILLTEEGEIEIADFGLAESFKKILHKPIGGTPLYLFPGYLRRAKDLEKEFIIQRMDPSAYKPSSEDIEIIAKIDLWAVGIVIYEMLFNKKFWDDLFKFYVKSNQEQIKNKVVTINNTQQLFRFMEYFRESAYRMEINNRKKILSFDQILQSMFDSSFDEEHSSTDFEKRLLKLIQFILNPKYKCNSPTKAVKRFKKIFPMENGAIECPKVKE